MKKLALIAGVAALAIPAVATAKDYSDRSSWESDDSQRYTYKRVDSSQDSGEYRIEMKSEEDFKGNPDPRRVNLNTKPLHFAIRDTNERLTIEGDTVYKVAENGDRFYAPNGSYITNNGLTVVVEDGELRRIEEPAEIVTLDDPFGGPQTRN